MIFKKLFKSTPKWQHDDAQVRLSALQELSLDNSDHKSIIERLATQDASENVRKAALERLNDFAMWVQASNKDKNERVKKRADEQIRQGLLGQASFTLDANSKQQFIDQCNKSHLLEELALKDQDEKLRFGLLQKLNKSNLFVQSLQDSKTSQWLKSEIVNKLDDLPTLEKLLKKADDGLKPLLTDKVDGIKAAIEKPKQLQKDVGLMLAKLNALKDKTDIIDIEQRQAQLQQQWTELKSGFDLLAQEQVEEFNRKYDKISTSLANIVAPLKQQWQQEQEAQADLANKQQNRDIIASRLAEVEAQLAQAISEHQNETAQDYAQPLNNIRQDMLQLNLAEQDKTGFIAQLEKLHQKVDQIPLITDCISEAMRLISLLSAMDVPTDSDSLKAVHPSYKAWQQNWKENQNKMGMAFPESITIAHKQLVTQWDEAINPILKEQDQLFSQARKAISELRYLLSSGKYRRAFGLFKKASFLFEQLNEWQKNKLTRDFETIKAKVEDLADWQSYIATPRKQQLLEEMLELANNPVESPQEQAQKVKFTRQMWNSLGRSEDEGDKQVNEQFDQACEQAFEVCRKFYAEQEAARARNLEAKQQVCERLRQAQSLLEQDPVPWQKLESELAAARKAFKAIGEVDREQVKPLNDEFYGLLKPMQQALRSYQNDNASMKEKLLHNAQNLLAQADVFDAANQLKDLQKKWKTIGFAGGKTDGAIWRKFREVNDQVFARRDEVKNQRNEQNQAQLDEFNQQLNEIEQLVQNSDEMSVLNKNLTVLEQLETSLREQPKAIEAKISSAVDKLKTAITTRKQQLNKKLEQDKYQAMFAQFEQVSKTGEIDPQIGSANSWNTLLKAMPETSDLDGRYDITIQLEIVAGVESPARDTDRRMALQMELLSNKMSGGGLAQQEQLLKDWIALGRLNPQETDLLERVKALYLV